MGTRQKHLIDARVDDPVRLIRDVFAYYGMEADDALVRDLADVMIEYAAALSRSGIEERVDRSVENLIHCMKKRGLL